MEYRLEMAVIQQLELVGRAGKNYKLAELLARVAGLVARLLCLLRKVAMGPATTSGWLRCTWCGPGTAWWG